MLNLKCVKCNLLLSCPPIVLHSGGNICGRCTSNLSRAEPRNRAFEALARLQHMPCRYQTSGCYELLKFDDVKTHEECCYYRQFSCPWISHHYMQCSWEGPSNKMAAHYNTNHNEIVYKTKTPLSLSLKMNFTQNIFFEALYKPFILHLNYDDNSFILWCGVIYFTQPDKGKRYEFEIVLMTKNKKYSIVSDYCMVANTFKPSTTVLCDINFNQISSLVKDTNNVQYTIDVSMVDDTTSQMPNQHTARTSAGILGTTTGKELVSVGTTTGKELVSVGSKTVNVEKNTEVVRIYKALPGIESKEN